MAPPRGTEANFWQSRKLSSRAITNFSLLFVNLCDGTSIATEMESARRGELKEYKDLPGGPQGTLAPWSSRRREMQPRRDVDGGGQSHAPWPRGPSAREQPHRNPGGPDAQTLAVGRSIWSTWAV